MIYHAVICCGRDNRWLDWHVRHVSQVVGNRINEQCVFFGTSDEPIKCQHRHEVVGCRDTYENLPVKTYCLLRHALKNPKWSRLLKTDCNAEIVQWTHDAVLGNELIGYTSTVQGGRHSHRGRVAEEAYNEDYGGPLPGRWVGGPAYIVSRRLAELIVARGVWYARSHAYEDQMISLVAEEHGIPASPGIVYRDADESVLS